MENTNSYAGDCRLLENYIEFLGHFRGTVRRLADRIEVKSDRLEFTMLFPLQALPKQQLMGFTGSVISLPWLESADQAIQESGLKKRGEIVFMSKTAAPSPQKDKVTLRLAKSSEDMENFSLVQGRGFLETEDTFKDWHPWLRAANVRNLGNKNCKFLIAEIGGKPASVSLLVEAKDSCGIYAVATPPEYRKKGLSTFLLNASEHIAREAGCHDVCLQVNANTYAHSFYAKLGFKEDYRIGLWKK